MDGNSDLVFLQLLAAFLLWLLLPLVPALSELFRPKDAAPLQAVGNDAGKLTYFATSFTERAERDGLLGTTVPTSMRDGTTVIGVSRTVPLLDVRKPTQSVVVLLDSVALPEGVEFAGEVLARLAMPPGRRNAFRAVLGLHDVGLGEGSAVQRWVHAQGRLEVADHCRLFGRATSEHTIVLGHNVAFERLQAPVIQVAGSEVADVPAPNAGAAEQFVPDQGEEITAGYWRVNGDLVVPSGTQLLASVVCRGNIIVEDGARVTGAVKAHGELIVRPNAVVNGSLAARKRIVIETGAHVIGPVISEESVRVDAAVVGASDRASTVTAPIVELLPGATIYGAVMAGVRGSTSRG
jgi:predicted acyltransferase (DUF342 family)